ncbi:hypothetical protein BZZ08_01299 [Streptomyces sp. MH60]|nr:hypothetical protein BZZ08_01299 [Streptomyces sp. MH60]
MVVAVHPGYQNLRNAGPSDRRGELCETDSDGNVQPLFRPCHRHKTREDFGAAGPSF